MILHRCLGLAAALAGVWTLAACSRYQERPLDLDAHRAAFLAREAGSGEVATYAASLRASGAVAPEAFDVADGITLPEGEVIALVFNSELRMARLRAGVATASADNAGLWADPVFGADFTRITQSVANPWKSMLTLSFTIPLSGRLGLEKEAASAEARAEMQRVLTQEWETRVELRRQWTQWTAAQNKCDVLREFVDRMDDVLKVVELHERAGEMPRIEARLFRLERASRESLLHQAEADRDSALIAIRRTMGLAPSAPLTLVSGIAIEDRGVDQLRAAVEEGASPRLGVARVAYEAAEKALELEVRKQYPDLVIGPGYGREDGQDQVLLGLSAPLPIFNRNQQAIAKATAERELSRAMFEDEYERMVSEFAMSETALAAARRQREQLEAQIVPMVDEQYADARRVASLGEVNTIVLLETLTRQQEAKLALIDATRAEGVSMLALEALAGPGIRPSKKEEVTP